MPSAALVWDGPLVYYLLYATHLLDRRVHFTKKVRIISAVISDFHVQFTLRSILCNYFLVTSCVIPHVGRNKAMNYEQVTT